MRHTSAASHTPDARVFFTSKIISGIPSSSRRTRFRNSPRAERISVAPNPPPQPTTPAHPPLRPRPPVACRRNIAPTKPPSTIPDRRLVPSDPITRFRLAPPAPLSTFRPLVPPPMPSAILPCASRGCFCLGPSLEADARRSTGFQPSPEIRELTRCATGSRRGHVCPWACRGATRNSCSAPSILGGGGC